MLSLLVILLAGTSAASAYAPPHASAVAMHVSSAPYFPISFTQQGGT